MSTHARQVELARTPKGAIEADDFRLVEFELPAPRPDQLVVRNLWMTVDPYMRLGLGDQAGFLAPLQPGDPLDGAAVGWVEQSSNPDLPVGSVVLSNRGWRSHFIADADELSPIGGDFPAEWHLGILGLTGVTAYLGVEEVLDIGTGETLLVSGATGAVGSIAVQLARLRGAKVLATCSSEEKGRWLLETGGADAVCNYKVEKLDDFLAREAPDGLDCAFDNVGGDMLDAILRGMKPYGRIALCGSMAQYQTGDYRHGPADFFTVIEKSLTLRGFNAFLLPVDRRNEIVDWLGEQTQAGRLTPADTIIDGLESAIASFVGLFDSNHIGKLLIRLDDQE